MKIVGAITFLIGILIAASEEYVIGGVFILFGASMFLSKEKKPKEAEWTIGGAGQLYIIQGFEDGIWKDLEVETEGSLIQTAFCAYTQARTRMDRIQTAMHEPLRIVKRTTVEEVIAEKEVSA